MINSVLKPSLKQRYAIFYLGCLIIVVVDFFGSPLLDVAAVQGEVYRHGGRAPVIEADAASPLRGSDRVIFNFRHFFHWWLVPPTRARRSLLGLLTSDGNGIGTNVFGHFCCSLMLSFLALRIVLRVGPVFVLGTILNVFHEYVAEGHYVDPSFIDLWLDQLGLIVAIALYVAARRAGKQGSVYSTT